MAPQSVSDLAVQSSKAAAAPQVPGRLSLHRLTMEASFEKNKIQPVRLSNLLASFTYLSSHFRPTVNAQQYEIIIMSVQSCERTAADAAIYATMNLNTAKITSQSVAQSNPPKGTARSRMTDEERGKR